MEKYLQLLILLMAFIVTIHTKEYDKIYSTDVCEQSGLQLFCKSKSVLKIHNVTCLPYNYTCPEHPKVLRLCDGQSSCTSIGLRQQFQSFCLHPERTIIITYQCVPVEHDPPCRTNICSPESEGLQCKDGSVIHILRTLCVDGKQECSWKVYNTLFGLCETQKSCYASGLRPLMPKHTCDVHFIHEANVFIDYVCIQDVAVDETCAGDITTMTRDFGIVKSPGFPNNPNGNPKKCYWAVYPARDQIVEITIHLAFSRDFTDNCNSRFLQVTYTDCTDKQLQRKITDSFCKASLVNIVKRSCGVAYIQNRSYRAGEDRGNRFVVSYEVKNMRSMREPSYHRYRSKCFNGDADASVTSTAPYIDGINQMGNSTYDSPRSGFHPWRFLTLLKVIVVNIFLFIIAVALVIAIIWVCYRYRQVSKVGKYTLSTQSDTDSGRRTNDTPLQTFSESASPAQGNSMHSFNYNERSPNTYASLHSEEPYATVDRSQYYPDPNIGGANAESHGVTTFMSPRDESDTGDHYASYSSLNYEVPSHRQHPYSYPQHVNSQQEPEEEFPPPPEELQQNYPVATSDDVPHYTINDDDYAIVQKPRKQQYNNINNHYQGYDPIQNNSVPHSASHRPNRHNQFQPEVGYLPQHRCMLEDNTHVCNVPPFKSNPSRHSNNVNHYHNPYINPRSEKDYY